MILTLLIFIFVFRIRFPLSEHFELNKQQFRFSSYLFLSLYVCLIVFSLNISMKHVFFISIGIVFLDFFILFVMGWHNNRKLERDCYLFTKYVVHQLKLGNSLYSSFHSFFDKTDALTPQKHKYFLESVFFPQQKSRFIPNNQSLIELKECLQFACDNLSQARYILSTYQENLKNREQIKRKVRLASQSAKAQAWVCALLFFAMLFYQVQSYKNNNLSLILFFSVTFFVIGFLSIFYCAKRLS